MLIKILIFFFLSLIIYQLFAQCFNKKSIVEGMDTNGGGASASSSGYKDYNKDDPNNALILSQQNAGNIEVLKNQMNDLTTVKSEFDDVKSRMDKLDGQVTDLVNQQAQYAQDVAGAEPPTVTGTDDNADDEEDQT